MSKIATEEEPCGVSSSTSPTCAAAHRDGNNANLAETVNEGVTCSICGHIFHECVSVLPCLHSFCGACLYRWTAADKETCPKCRGLVTPEKIAINPDMRSFVDGLIKFDPRYQTRSAAELEEFEKAYQKLEFGRGRDRQELDRNSSSSLSTSTSSNTSSGSSTVHRLASPTPPPSNPRVALPEPSTSGPGGAGNPMNRIVSLPAALPAAVPRPIGSSAGGGGRRRTSTWDDTSSDEDEGELARRRRPFYPRLTVDEDDDITVLCHLRPNASGAQPQSGSRGDNGDARNN